VRGRGRLLALIAALALVLAAHELGRAANRTRSGWPKTLDPPYSPSPASAPFLALGYRELFADLLWIRALGYVGSDDHDAAATGGLIEAIIALDPRFERAYAWGGLAMTSLGSQATRADMMAAIRVLEHGMALFPDDYKLPLYAGQIYTVDLQSDDPAEKRRWELEGARMLERAVRVPGAPKDLGTFAAFLRTKLGQRDKAIRDLRELVLYTTDAKQRDKLVQKLAELEETDAASLANELEVEKHRFDDRWRAERPELTATMYVLVGPPLPHRFHLEDLAVDRDLVGVERPIEPLPPLTD
jgi:hypothetical protein